VRLAVISDVHGNLLALDAVLADIALQGVDAIVCLGDHVSGPLDPVGAADRIMALDGPVIRGNHDRWVIASDRPADRVDQFAAAQLNPGQKSWLADLPATAVWEGEVFLCHGTPQSDEAAWLDNFWHDRKTTLPSEASVTAEADGIDYPVLLCGHTHMARSVRLRDGRLIFNPGSVGLQLVHGSPDARYGLLERRQGRWLTRINVVPYDTEAAAAQARANGFASWAEAITTGWTGPEGMF
jgi:putative phosphoesterase